MYDLAVYGHLTIDRIFTDFEESLSLGAIGNFWEAVVFTDRTISLDLKPTALGEAIIMVNKNKCTRLGRGFLNLQTAKAKLSKAKWHHVMYLNQLEDVSFISQIEDDCIVSADLTSGKMNNLEFLQYIDYLFISDEDLFMDVEQLARLVKGWVVLHYPAGSYCTDGENNFSTETKTLKNINVLGAGDMFAAGFIVRNIVEKHDIKKCIKFAHENTTKLLLRRNDGGTN